MSIDVLSEQRVRSRCSWDTYEQLLRENVDSAAPRFTFDRGWLEIMSPSLEHERVNSALRQLIMLIADELSLDLLEIGSTTFRCAELQRGFEPDSSYYSKHAAVMRAAPDVDLSIHPAPELVVEIDISRSSYGKLELFQAMGVGEVWRWCGQSLTIFVLGPKGYDEVPASQLLPLACAQSLTDLVIRHGQQSRPEWRQTVQAWLDKR